MFVADLYETAIRWDHSLVGLGRMPAPRVLEDGGKVVVLCGPCGAILGLGHGIYPACHGEAPVIAAPGSVRLDGKGKAIGYQPWPPSP